MRQGNACNAFKCRLLQPGQYNKTGWDNSCGWNYVGESIIFPTGKNYW